MTATRRAFNGNPSYLEERPVHIECADGELSGSLGGFRVPLAVALIANDTGAARHRCCELELARALHDEGIATLMVDVVTADEQAEPEAAARLRLDAMKLAHRIGAARAWIAAQPELRGLPVAVLGEGGAGAAALIEAAAWPHMYAAVVARSAQPLHAGLALEQCALPVLLVAAARDEALLARNRAALDHLRGDVNLLAIAGAARSAPVECQPVEAFSQISRWLAEHLVLPRTPALAKPSLRDARHTF